MLNFFQLQIIIREDKGITMVFGLFKKKDKNKDEKTTQKDDRYLQLTVKDIVSVTNDAVNVVFEKPETVFNYLPGQFITVIFTIDGKKVRRAYSLCTTPGVDENPAVTVKRVEGGIVSNYINDQLKVGDEVEIMEPMGMFTTEYQVENDRHLILIGGGSGITPLYSIIKATLAREPKSIVSLVYANRNEDSVIFKDQLESLVKEQKGRFKLIHTLDKPTGEWDGHMGLLTNDKLKSIFSELPKHDPKKTEYFTCGPQPLMDIVFDTLNEMEVPLEYRYRESFVAGKTSPDSIISDGGEGSADQDRSVKVIIDGDSYEFTVPAGKSILDAGLEADIDMPYSCQSGLCTACRGKCHSGKVSVDDADGLSQQELNEGYVLTCIGKPLSDDVEIEIG